jgi:putative transposase
MQKYFVAHKYRLKPTQEQALVLEQWSHINRWTWNHFLAHNCWKYEFEKKFEFYNQMANMLPALKQEHEFLKQPPAHALQSIVQRLETAITRVWKLGAGFPRFKSRKNGDLPSSHIPQVNKMIKWTKKEIQVPKLGWIKWAKHRPLRGRLVAITLKYEAGHWWCVVLCQTNKPIKSTDGESVGIDLGLNNWITLSDGTTFDIHPFLMEKEQEVKRQQRVLSKKTKGSNNRTKQKKKLQRAHFKVRSTRNDQAHKVSNAIAKQYTYVAMEDLNIKGMMRNRHLARRIAQVSWGQLKNFLSCKAEVSLVDRFYPSTKTCSCCGHIQDMPLDKRIFDCEKCDLVLGRDVNAAINIRNRAGTARINACRDTSTGDEVRSSSRQVSLKQEKFRYVIESEAA